MAEKTDTYQPSHGAPYFFGGIAVLLLSALLLTNANEGEWFGLAGLVLLGAAGYLLLVGGVARGIQVARGPRPPDQH
jgi:hypothetical protein